MRCIFHFKGMGKRTKKVAQIRFTIRIPADPINCINLEKKKINFPVIQQCKTRENFLRKFKYL